MADRKGVGGAPQVRRSGMVTLEMPSGDVYEGTVVDDRPHGQGQMRLKDGGVYEGAWKNGERHGTGTMKFARGAEYVGEWKDGMKNGTGTCRYADGGEYVGEWKGDKYHGQGTRKYANGVCYEGEWKDGRMHGMGTLRYVDGGVYEGGWKGGHRHGNGTLKYPDGATVYRGEWKRNKKNGTGTYKFANGNIYEGGWEDDKMHGFGTYTLSDGSFIDGGWKDGARILPTPPKENIRDAISSVLLKDEATVDIIDALPKWVPYLTDLLHESNLAQHVVGHSMEDILRPWLKNLGFDDNIARECSDAVMRCARRWDVPMVPLLPQQRGSDGVDETTQALAGKTDVIFVHVVGGGDGAVERYSLLSSSPLEIFLKNYGTSRNVSVRRFEHNGCTRFLSDIGKKSPRALGLKDGDEIKIVIAHDSNELATTKEKENTPKRQSPSGKKKKHKHRKKSSKKKSVPIVLPVSEEKRFKEQHSHALSRVFEEADLRFGEIRQRLAAMNLQRMMPKQRKSQPKEEIAVAETVVDNPPADGLGGKAGKAFFVVQVGEANNLYNTRAKPSNGGGKQSPGGIAREIDLHGCTKEEALVKLDECLPEWVDAAMKGEYPWVIAVRIVCGGGSQTLAEAVEGWIKRNPNVSNAPKNLYS